MKKSCSAPRQGTQSEVSSPYRSYNPSPALSLLCRHLTAIQPLRNPWRPLLHSALGECEDWFPLWWLWLPQRSTPILKGRWGPLCRWRPHPVRCSCDCPYSSLSLHLVSLTWQPPWSRSHQAPCQADCVLAWHQCGQCLRPVLVHAAQSTAGAPILQ